MTNRISKLTSNSHRVIDLIYPRPKEPVNGELNLSAKKRDNSDPKKKKSRKIKAYWIIVLFLTAWMLYLNVNVLLEYGEIREQYTDIQKEYEKKKEELELKMQEYEKLRRRVENTDGY